MRCNITECLRKVKADNSYNTASGMYALQLIMIAYKIQYSSYNTASGMYALQHKAMDIQVEVNIIHKLQYRKRYVCVAT